MEELKVESASKYNNLSGDIIYLRKNLGLYVYISFILMLQFKYKRIFISAKTGFTCVFAYVTMRAVPIKITNRKILYYNCER